MHITVTDSAMQHLAQQTSLQQGKGVRIIAEYEGGSCACTVEVHMKIDDIKPEDVCAKTDNVAWMIDNESKKLIGADAITISYNQGFTITSLQETIAYNLPLKA